VPLFFSWWIKNLEGEAPAEPQIAESLIFQAAPQERRPPKFMQAEVLKTTSTFIH